MRRILFTLILLLGISTQSWGQAYIKPAFSKYSGAGGSVDAQLLGTNTMQVTGATFSSPGGKPTMTIDIDGQTIAPADIIASGPWVDSRSASWSIVTSQSITYNRPLHITQQINITSNTDLSAVPEIDVIQGGSFNVSAGVTLTLPVNFHAGMTQVFYGSGLVTGPRTVRPEWRGAVGDGATDSTAALQTTYNEVATDATILISGTYVTGGNTLTKRCYLKGEGAGHWWGINGGRLQARDATQTYLLKFGGVANAVNIGGAVSNVVFYGANSTFSDAMVVCESWSSMHFIACGFHNAIGSAVRLRVWYEGIFDRCLWRDNDSSGTANGMIYIDQVYNSDLNNNVNNLNFDFCHFERNWGSYFVIHTSSNLDVLRLRNSKFEWGWGGTDAPSVPGSWSLFNFAGGNRVSVIGNHFTNYNSAKSYNTLLTQTGGSVIFAENDLSATDANTYLAQLSGTVSATIKNNTVTTWDGSMPMLSNSSARALEYEAPRQSQNISYPFLQAPSQTYNKVLGAGLISAHRMGFTNQNFVVDTDVQNPEGTAYRESSIVSLMLLPMQAFKDYPNDLKISLRCKSPTGTAKIGFQVGSSNMAVLTPNTTYDTSVSWTIKASQLAGLGNSGTDRLKIYMDGTSSGYVYIDGIYITPLPSVNGVMSTTSTQSILNTKMLTLANSATGTFDMRSGTNNSVNGRGMVLVTANYAGGAYAMVYLDGAALYTVFASANVSAATANPNTAGKLNLYLSSTGVLGVLNNLGSTRDVSITYFPSDN